MIYLELVILIELSPKFSLAVTVNVYPCLVSTNTSYLLTNFLSSLVTDFTISSWLTNSGLPSLKVLTIYLI